MLEAPPLTNALWLHICHAYTCLLASHSCLVAPIDVPSQLAMTDDWTCTAGPPRMLTATPAWQFNCVNHIGLLHRAERIL